MGGSGQTHIEAADLCTVQRSRLTTLHSIARSEPPLLVPKQIEIGIHVVYVITVRRSLTYIFGSVEIGNDQRAGCTDDGVQVLECCHAVRPQDKEDNPKSASLFLFFCFVFGTLVEVASVVIGFAGT